MNLGLQSGEEDVISIICLIKSSSSELPMVNLFAGPSVPSPSPSSDGRGCGTLIMLL